MKYAAFHSSYAEPNRSVIVYMRKQPILHPIFFAIMPVVSMLAANIASVTISQVIRPTVVIFASTLIVLVLLNIIVNDWHRAALIVSIFLVLFFSYGHVYELIEGVSLAGIKIGRHRFLLLAWIGIFTIGTIGALRTSSSVPRITKILNFIAATVLMISSYQIVDHEINLHQLLTGSVVPNNSLGNSPKVINEQVRPDIFYIILDAYGRADILQEIYGFDNSKFINFLKDRDFFVASKSRCNYSQTTLSLASSLNLDYLDFVIDHIGEDAIDQKPITCLILQSKVRHTLESMGYQTVAFATGYRRTEVSDVDIYFQPPQNHISPFESMLIRHSAISILQESSCRVGWQHLYPGYAAHRQIIEYTLDHLPQLADNNVPDFVFAHIIAPHPPFVFGPNGEKLNPQYPFAINDGDEYPGRMQEYIEGYRDQIVYLNSRLEEVIEEILDGENIPPVIILQADHGPGFELNWQNPQDTNLSERMSIFNAYYLPGITEGLLYESISPVNSFRIVFNQLFGMEYDLLRDESYFSSWRWPYKFILAPEEPPP